VTLRLFVAVDPDEAAVADLAALVDGLAVARPAPPGGSLRLTRRDAWHITLAFIGEVPDTDRPAAEAALARVGGAAVGASGRGSAPVGSAPVGSAPVGSAPVGSAGAPVVRIAGGGRFNRGRFTVLWAGVDGDVDGLAALATAVRRELRRVKLPIDRKAFRPHLTIARPGDRLPADALAADIASLAAYAGPPWTVARVHLYASELGPHPAYTRLASVNVGTVTLGGGKERGTQR
jgi:2'-5' RNA ligase